MINRCGARTRVVPIGQLSESCAGNNPLVLIGPFSLKLWAGGVYLTTHAHTAPPDTLAPPSHAESQKPPAPEYQLSVICLINYNCTPVRRAL